MDGIRVSWIEQRAFFRYNCFIKNARHRTVKMQPEGFKTGICTVGMSCIAIQKNRADLTQPALSDHPPLQNRFLLKCTLEENCRKNPVPTDSRFRNGKEPVTDWIEKQFMGNGTWGVYVIIGIWEDMQLR